jgi:hypothetical protein
MLTAWASGPTPGKQEMATGSSLNTRRSRTNLHGAKEGGRSAIICAGRPRDDHSARIEPGSASKLAGARAESSRCALHTPCQDLRTRPRLQRFLAGAFTKFPKSA